MHTKKTETKQEDARLTTKTPAQETPGAAPPTVNSLLVQRMRHAPSTVTPNEVLQLQRTFGNQAVNRLLNRSTDATLERKEEETEFSRFSLAEQNGLAQQLLTQELSGKAQAATPAASTGVALQRAFTAGDPTTYDNDGGHGYGDHGPQTTEEQHKTRLETGTTPSGRSADIPDSSSKFASLEIMKNAIASAVIDAAKDSVSKGSKRSKARISLGYNVKNAGISYTLDTSDPKNVKVKSANVDWIVIILEQTGPGKWDKQYDKIITMFPSATAPKQKDN